MYLSDENKKYEILESLAKDVLDEKSREVGYRLEKDHGLFDINGFCKDGYTPLFIAIWPEKLGKGRLGCLMFEKLIMHGADPCAPCSTQGNENVIDYVNGVLEALVENPIDDTLLIKIREKGGTVEAARKAIAFIKHVIRREYRNLQIPDPAVVRAAVTAKKLILLRPNNHPRGHGGVWQEGRQAVPPARILRPTPAQWQRPHPGGN